jgi:hypothetical protein
MRNALVLATALSLATLVGCDGDADDDTTDNTPSDDGSSGDTASTDCDAAADGDGDGLDDCAEAEVGTDPAVADTDGDGLSDGEETDCVSNPLDADETCYACGWQHGDPGTLQGSGSSEGDVIDNIEFIDQCGEAVELWDFAGEWRLMFMTTAWCGTCKAEAITFEAAAAAFSEATGQPNPFLLVLFASTSGGLPDASTGVRYAEEIDAQAMPVLVDPRQSVLADTPYDGARLPGVCVLSPDMEMVFCDHGEGLAMSLLQELQDSF